MVNNSWKTVTLSQIGTFRKGSGISRAESNSGTLPAVRYGELYTVHNNYVRTYTSHISREVANQALRVHYGDILFACSGETKEDIAKCAAIIDDSEVYAGGDIIVLSPTTEVDPIFLGFILNTQNVIQQRAQKAQGDAIVHISTDSIKSIEITLPGYEEQVRIAEALSDIDTLIVNLEKLIAKYELIKKACLQQMFPQNGEKVHKMRLPGFTGAWEQRKLGEVLLLLKDGTHGTHQDVDKGPLLLSAKNIKSGKIRWDNTDRRISQSDYEKIHSTFRLQVGDVLLTIVGSIGEAAILRDSEGITFQRSVAFLRPNEEVKSDFLCAEISSEHFQKELDNRKSTSAQPGIYLGDLGEIPFVFPKDISEQKQIGEYFRNLDRLITLHQCKLEKVRQIKQGMMSELLTGRIRL